MFDGTDNETDWNNASMTILAVPDLATSLSIWDQTDPRGGSHVKYIGETVTFYADYTYAGGDVLGANCTIWFDDTGPLAMSYYPYDYYVYSRTFPSHGEFSWNVTCNATGYEFRSDNDTVVVSGPPVGTIGIRLTLPGLTNQVQVPGIATGGSGQLAQGTWERPSHYYIASWLSDTVYGLVHYYQDARSVGLERTSSNHTLVLVQNLTNSHALVVFTAGDWVAINNRMAMIESAAFMEKIAPSFAYGLGLFYPIKIILKTDTNILNDVIIHTGTYPLSFTYNITEGEPGLTVAWES
jgi:hypothetical protein